MINFSVNSIKPKQTYEWLLKKHYTKSVPPITWAFGIFDDLMPCVCTFGKPCSHPVRIGVCGDENSDKVYELNRLVINDHCPKNTASYFVSRCLKKIPKDLIIISYADTSMGHIGKVYQATNWIYTGLSAKRTDWKVKGMEHLHGQTIADQSRGKENRADWMREKYGDDFYLQERPRKHRYVYFTGKKYKLNYPTKPYPKGESKRYDASYKPITQLTLF